MKLSNVRKETSLQLNGCVERRKTIFPTIYEGKSIIIDKELGSENMVDLSLVEERI